MTEDTARKLRETKPEVFTKEFAMRMRLRRDLNAPFPKAGHEYGDYEKYEKNNIEELNEKGLDDFGEDTFFKNYQNMLKQFNTPEGETNRIRDDLTIANTVENYKVPTQDLITKFNSARENLDIADTIFKMEQESKMI